MAAGHPDPVVLLDGPLAGLDGHNGRHVADGDFGPGVVHQVADALHGLDDGGLLVGLDVDPPLGLGRDGAGDAERTALPGVGGALVHDLVHELLLLAGGAADHEETGIGNRGHQRLLCDGAVILGPADAAGPAVQDRPIDAAALHAMALLDLSGHLGNVGLRQIPPTGLGTAAILQADELLGLFVELLLADILLGVVPPNDVVGIVM
mmetsp:Transcript_13426/g.38359  ORF Transcript_13426/g.38359 Transcript_13426/m.38359 type:complete len:207 (-) Transcript_13426:170-790(-)